MSACFLCRLGRALDELFGLLVKLCVGSPIRLGAHTRLLPRHLFRLLLLKLRPALTQLLTNGLAWEPPVTSPTPKFRLTFLICSMGFTSPMLFDEKKLPYHLMLSRFLCHNFGRSWWYLTYNCISWIVVVHNRSKNFGSGQQGFFDPRANRKVALSSIF